MPRTRFFSGGGTTVQPPTAPANPATLTTSAARGAYLVQLGECAGCHTMSRADGAPVREMLFGGGRRFRVERGVGNEIAGVPVYAEPGQAPATGGRVVASANLTPDPSGISYYSEAMFVQAIRTGKVGGVRAISAAMPWVFFGTMTDRDLKDIYAYLQTLRPVLHRVNNTDPPTFCPRCGRRHGMGELNPKGRPWQ